MTKREMERVQLLKIIGSLIGVFDYFGILEKEVVMGKNDDSTEKKEKVIDAMKKSPQFQYLRTHIDMIASLKDSSSDK